MFPIPFHHARALTFSFFLFFSLYRRTYSVPLVFIGTNGTLWRPVTHRRAECSANSPRPIWLYTVYPWFSDFCLGRILYREDHGRECHLEPLNLPLFAPARTFSTAKLLAWILTSADFRGYKFPLEMRVPLVFWFYSFVRLYIQIHVFSTEKS